MNGKAVLKLSVRGALAAIAMVSLSLPVQAQVPAAGIEARQVAVGDKPYQVQAAIAGSGKYTVIFESGFGSDLRAWRKVAPQVAASARVLTYSRAGHGASDARPEARTIAQNTAELEQLIAAGQLAPPFILVGHSYGALLVRSFAARHPQQVAGMVLVDPSDERFSPALRKLDAARAAEDDGKFAAIVPPRFKPELALLQPVLDSGVLPLAGKVPDVPVVVLTSVQHPAKAEFFLETPEAVAIKRGLHADFARQFTDGAQVVTANSGHDIQMEEPQLVIDAVRKVIDAADKRRAAPRSGGI